MHHIYYRKEVQISGSECLSKDETWRFAQQILRRPIPHPNPAYEARRERELLEWLAQISDKHAKELSQLQAAEANARHDRELLEWAAQISTEAEGKLRALERKEAAEREAWRRAEECAEPLLEGSWDPSQHPRAPRGEPDGGRWISNGGARSADNAATPSAPFRTASFRGRQAHVQLASFSGAPTATWPTTGPTSSWLPKVDSRVAAGAGQAAGIGAGAFLGGLRNASMGAYWSRIPGTQAMPQIWVYDLEKRVRAGILSREDAIGIFNTAVLGAQAQGFKPTGGTMSAVHKSATDFLASAEAVYFAKKKKAADAREGHSADAKKADARPERVTGEELARRRRDFDKMRPELWREEARRNPEKYSHEQLQQMRQGKPPKGSDGEPMEIHHKTPLSEGGTNTWDNFEIMTHTAHRRKPNFKPNHPNLPRGRSA